MIILDKYQSSTNCFNHMQYIKLPFSKNQHLKQNYSIKNDNWYC